jgi:putative salt-induced outer membrane protein YdiY
MTSILYFRTMNVKALHTATLLLLSVTFSLAQNEVIISKDGESVTGEIKGLRQNALTVETSYSDSDFQIDWEQVLRVQSSETFRILLSNGAIMEGSINSEADNEITITGDETLTVAILDIVELTGLDKGFWNRLTLGLSAGYSFTKASSTSQLNIRTYAGYMTEHWDLNADFSSNDTRIDTTQTRRVDAGLDYRYFVGRKWFAMAKVDWLSNTEQQLDLRTTSYLGFGNFLVRNYKQVLSVAAGGTYNNENFSDETATANSSEAFVSLDYKAFNIGDLSIFSNLTALPSLTESERVRMNFKIDLKWDLPKDFYFNAGYTLNYDSRPPNDASNSDFVFTTSVGWDL